MYSRDFHIRYSPGHILEKVKNVLEEAVMAVMEDIQKLKTGVSIPIDRDLNQLKVLINKLSKILKRSRLQAVLKNIVCTISFYAQSLSWKNRERTQNKVPPVVEDEEVVRIVMAIYSKVVPPHLVGKLL